VKILEKFAKLAVFANICLIVDLSGQEDPFIESVREAFRNLNEVDAVVVASSGNLRVCIKPSIAAREDLLMW
jgi:hypothetical protein